MGQKETPVATPVKCGVCGGQAYRNKSGQMLMHTVTVPGTGRAPKAEVCSGSTRGARP